jgi:hypothetical protein
MRTTLDLDEDVLNAAREIARAHGTTVGRVISELVKKALHADAIARIRNGVPLLPRRSGSASRPTMDFVNSLREG